MTTVRNIAAGVRSMTSNAFLVEGDRAVLVDAGQGFDAVARLEEATDDLSALVLTHTHPDHVGNVGAVVEAFDVDVWGFDPDHPLVDSIARLLQGVDDSLSAMYAGHGPAVDTNPTNHIELAAEAAGFG